MGILFEKYWMRTKDDVKKYFERNDIKIRIEEQLPDTIDIDWKPKIYSPKLAETMKRVKENARSKFSEGSLVKKIYCRMYW